MVSYLPTAAMVRQLRTNQLLRETTSFPDIEDAEPISISATIESGDAATVVLVSGESGIEVRTFEVNLDRTGTAEARIRLINASGDAGDVDFYGNDDRWFEGVGFPDASDYKDIGWESTI